MEVGHLGHARLIATCWWSRRGLDGRCQLMQATVRTKPIVGKREPFSPKAIHWVLVFSPPGEDYESGGREFESLRARHLVLVCEHQDCPLWFARTAFSSNSLFPLMRIW
jgi:hypothetical protein